MEEALELELSRAARTQSPVAVLMIDLDHFKRFNDSFGHQAGDSMMQAVAATLRSQIRGGDIACRYGGEEFLLILTDTTTEAGHQRAEAIRRGVTKIEVEHRGETLRRISVSIGVAAFPEHGESGAEIVKAADEALYRAKREGRDRVICAG
jgi:diguanylate cyclase (GGDEF)-like protein